MGIKNDIKYFLENSFFFLGMTKSHLSPDNPSTILNVAEKLVILKDVMVVRMTARFLALDSAYIYL